VGAKHRAISLWASGCKSGSAAQKLLACIHSIVARRGWRIRAKVSFAIESAAQDSSIQLGGRGMAYIFNEDQLPRLLSNGRERVFFVNKELTKIDDMLAGIMHYKQGAASPYHLHKNCEHFYFIMEGKATVQSEEGTREIGPGTMVFIPAEEKHRLRALEPLFYFEFQAPNRFQTTILEGTPDDLKWDRVDGGVWIQS
jgi:mannose-6-phosphate isomerase-like protein (cupin superfamily)